MKRILFTTVSLGVLGLMSPAVGADLSPYMKAPAAASPMYDWSGFYVGVYGGGGHGNHNLTNTNGFTGNANFTTNWSSSGAIGGVETGYNVQSGNYLVGFEGDVFWSNIKGDDAFALGSNDASNLRFGGSARARGGITVDRLLLFFTGGWAYGEFQHTNTDPVLGVDRFTAHRSGLTAGGGIAYAITNNLIGKLEYRYYDFGRYERIAPLNGQIPYTVDNTYSVVTLGLDFKFGGPVVAKY